LCLWLLSVFGWRTVFHGLPGTKGIVVVYPHTSNWDFAVGMLYRLGYGLPMHWLAKHSLFRWPLGGLLRWLGGIPVDRRAPQGAIQAIAEEFERRDFLWIAVTPEGTRSHTDHWKSGFYRIALAAGVPCGLGYMDYPSKTLGIDTFLEFTGDVASDIEKIAGFYANRRGLYPEKAGEIRLRAPTPDDPDPADGQAGRSRSE
jgi:1-acyl-sn-glycerol-3-phosphate acyltransferase